MTRLLQPQPVLFISFLFRLNIRENLFRQEAGTREEPTQMQRVSLSRQVNIFPVSNTEKVFILPQEGEDTKLAGKRRFCLRRTRVDTHPSGLFFPHTPPPTPCSPEGEETPPRGGRLRERDAQHPLPAQTPQCSPKSSSAPGGWRGRGIDAGSFLGGICLDPEFGGYLGENRLFSWVLDPSKGCEVGGGRWHPGGDTHTHTRELPRY